MAPKREQVTKAIHEQTSIGPLCVRPLTFRSYVDVNRPKGC